MTDRGTTAHPINSGARSLQWASGCCSPSSPGCLVSCFPMLPEMAVADQSPAFFIPKPERDGFQARNEGDRFYLLKKRIGFVALLQIVIWNARTQVMNVVKPDVAGKPLQDPRQFVERTALECRCRKTPIVTPLPINIFKLMLDVEEPDPRATGNHQDDQLNQKVRPNAKC